MKFKNLVVTLGTMALVAGCDNPRDHSYNPADYAYARQKTAEMINSERQELIQKRRSFYQAQREEYKSLSTVEVIAGEGDNFIRLAKKYAPDFRDAEMMVNYVTSINSNVWGADRRIVRIGQKYQIPTGVSTNQYPGDLR